MPKIEEQYTKVLRQGANFYDIYEKSTGKLLTPEDFRFVGLDVDWIKPSATVPRELSSISSPSTADDLAKTSLGETLKTPSSGGKNFYDEITKQTASLDARLAEEKRLLDLEKEREEAKTERKGIREKVEGFFKGRKTQEQLAADLEAKYQIPETLKTQRENLETMRNLRQQSIVLQTEFSQARSILEARAGVPRGIMGAQTQELERQYAIRQAPVAAQLSALGAYDEALRGNVTQATQLMARYIDAATYEDNIKFKEYEFMLDENKTIISQLDKDIQNALNNKRDDLKTELNTRKDELTQIGKLVIENPQANWSGFDFQKGTVEQALAIAATAPKAELKEEIVGGFRVLRDATGKVIFTQAVKEDGLLSISEAQNLGVPYGTTKQQAAKMGITPEKEPKAILTQTQINAFATAGVPQEMALIIQQDRNNGFSWEQIQENLATQLGNEINARAVITNFKKVAERQQSALDILYQLAQ